MSGSQYDDMTWQAIKKLVIANGGDWTNVKDGVAFLEAKEAETEAPAAIDDGKPLGWDNQAGEPAPEPVPVAKDEGKDITAGGFNPDEPYGEVCGIDIGNAKYYQNGQHYDANGNPVKV